MANKQDVDLKFSIIDGVTKFITDLKVAIKGVGTSFTELNQLSELVGKGFDKIGAAAARIGDAVAGAAEFQSAMAALAAVTGAVGDQFDALEAAAVSASEATKFSSVEAAQGLTELARAGLDTAAAISTLNPVLALAQGQQLSVAEAAETVTIAMTQFGLETEEAARVADVYASAADKSQLSVQSLALAMSYAGPLARQLGLSLEETTAIIGKLADEGFRGEKGGTALRSVFTALVDPSSKFREELEKLGIKSTDFSTVLEELSKKGNGARDALLALDASASPAITSLVSKGSAGIRELTEALEKSQGAAQTTADILGNTFEVQSKKLTNTLANIRNALLVPIFETLSVDIDKFSARISAFAASDQFARITQQVTEFVGKSVEAFASFVESINFDQTVAAVEEFATNVNNAFNGIVAVVKFFADSVNTALDLAQIGFGEVVSALTGTLATLYEALGAFSESAALIGNRFRAMQVTAKELSEGSLKDLEKRFGTTKEESEKLKKGIDDAAAAAKIAKGDFKDLADSLPKIGIESIAKNFDLVADSVQTGTFNMVTAVRGAKEPLDAFGNAISDVGKSAKNAKSASFSMVEGIEAVSDAARKSEIRNLEIEYGRLLVAAGKGADNGGELSQVRDRLQELSTAGERAGQGANAAKDGVDSAKDSADNAGQSFADYGAQAGIAAEESDRLADSGGRVAESLEGVADAASQSGRAFETNTALGKELTAAFLNASNSFGNYQQFFFQNLKNINDQAKVGNEQLKEAVKLAELRDPQLQREVQIRQQLLETYRVGGPELDKLVAIRVKEAEAADNEKLKQEAEQRDAVNKRVAESTKSLAEITAAREKERKEREASLAVGAQELAQNQQLVATQPKPGSTNNVTINVTVNGMPSTKEAWRDIIANIILPEFKRLERLEQ